MMTGVCDKFGGTGGMLRKRKEKAAMSKATATKDESEPADDESDEQQGRKLRARIQKPTAPAAAALPAVTSTKPTRSASRPTGENREGCIDSPVVPSTTKTTEMDDSDGEVDQVREGSDEVTGNFFSHYPAAAASASADVDKDDDLQMEDEDEQENKPYLFDAVWEALSDLLMEPIQLKLIRIMPKDVGVVERSLYLCTKDVLQSKHSVAEVYGLFHEKALPVALPVAYWKDIVAWLQTHYAWPEVQACDAGQAGFGQPPVARWADVHWLCGDSILKACQHFYDMDAYDGTSLVPLVSAPLRGVDFKFTGREQQMEMFVKEFGRRVDNPSSDRNNAPVPAAAGSPGTGKSRLADEIGNRLREKLMDMDVIDVRVTFSSLTIFNSVQEAHLHGIGVLCARMLYMTVAQFPRRDTGEHETWDDFRDSLLGTEFGSRIRLRNICRVLRAAAGIEEGKKCCVYLAMDECTRLEPVDALANVQGVTGAAQNLLEVVVRLVGQLMVQPDDTMWIAPLFLATDVASVKRAFRSSSHPPFELAMTLLTQSDVVQAINPVIPGWQASAKFMRTLADMGGNMRAVEEMIVAVEAQWNRLPAKRREIHNIRFQAVFVEVVAKLKRYPLPSAAACFSTIQHSILGIGVNHATVVDATTFGDLESSGLLTLTESDATFVVSQPFVQLYRMVSALKAQVEYSEIAKSIPCDWGDIYKWADWEQFNVRYEACRLTLFRKLGQVTVRLKDLYRGARMSKAMANRYIYLKEDLYTVFETDVKFNGQNLKQRLLGTGDYSGTEVTSVWQDGGYMILNGPAAPYADSFCYCPKPPKKAELRPPLRAYSGLRLFQYKLRETDSGIDVSEEAEKSGCSATTLFSLHTNFKFEDDAFDELADKALWAVVSHTEFEAYYGPYAGRATYAFGMDAQPVLTHCSTQQYLQREYRVPSSVKADSGHQWQNRG
eukprot:TRINITY_DN4013_c1_g1_i1.p1 TRINITY_DN4013_c1_g1~~TRINITY_DN4013_c1_g1_i1.p1  ORF type:complete len:946 (+),score=142.71 TRINITY_DN4013_c1_g1_i1:185-3022(+)